MTVKIFKLTTGEEVIGTEEESTRDGITLKSPAVILMRQTQDGKFSVALAPYMAYAEFGKVYVYRTAIAADCEPDIQMVNEYNRIYGSGIEIANVMPSSSIQLS
jgi:hypothetical protein